MVVRGAEMLDLTVGLFLSAKLFLTAHFRHRLEAIA